MIRLEIESEEKLFSGQSVRMSFEKRHPLLETLIGDGRNLLFQLGDFSLGFIVTQDEAFNNLPGFQSFW